MIDAFSQLKFWSVFDIFDARKLTQSVTEISIKAPVVLTSLLYDEYFFINMSNKINWKMQPIVKTVRFVFCSVGN